MSAHIYLVCIELPSVRMCLSAELYIDRFIRRSTKYLKLGQYMLNQLITKAVCRQVSQLPPFAQALFKNDSVAIEKFIARENLVTQDAINQCYETINQAAAACNVPVLLLGLLTDNIDLFRSIFALYPVDKRKALLLDLVNYVNPENGINLVMGLLYSKKPEITQYLYKNIISKSENLRAKAKEKDFYRRNLVAHIELSRNFDRIPYVISLIGQSEYDAQLKENNVAHTPVPASTPVAGPSMRFVPARTPAALPSMPIAASSTTPYMAGPSQPVITKPTRIMNLIDLNLSDFEYTKNYFNSNPSEMKCDKKVHSLKNSYIKVNRKIYAIKRGTPLGKGGEGKAKIIQNAKGKNYKVKIEGRGLRATTEPVMRVMNHLNLIKGQAERDYGRNFLGQVCEKKLYTVMEYVDGKDLSEQQPLIITSAPARKLVFSIKAAEALKEFHDKRVIHVDIKPKNIICKVEGDNINMRLIDFGYSRVLPEGISYNISGRRGTRGYKAPEIEIETEDKRVKYSFASDIYALGMMLQRDFQLTMPEGFFSGMLHQEPEKRLNIDEVIEALYIELSKQPELSTAEMQMIHDFRVKPKPAASSPFSVLEKRIARFEQDVQNCTSVDGLIALIRKVDFEIPHPEIGKPLNLKNIIANMQRMNTEIGRASIETNVDPKKWPEIFSGTDITRHFGIQKKFIELIKQDHALRTEPSRLEPLRPMTIMPAFDRFAQHSAQPVESNPAPIRLVPLGLGRR